MPNDTFLDLCKNFGDPSLPEAERWKSVKYISTEGQMEPLDFEFLFKHNEAYFINSEEYGTGFILIETPYTEFEPVNNNPNSPGNKKRIVTFIALTMVNSISFRTTNTNSVQNIIDNTSETNTEEGNA